MINPFKNITALPSTTSRGLTAGSSTLATSVDSAVKPREVVIENRDEQLLKYTKGFTLIEMLITLVIMSVLTMLVYPSYVAWIVKANRADAISAITQDQVLLERCYAQSFTYVGCSSLPAFPQTSTQGFYSIALSNLSATTYTLTATPIGSQVRDTTCATMSVDQSGQKTAANDSAVSQTACWNP